MLITTMLIFVNKKYIAY